MKTAFSNFSAVVRTRPRCSEVTSLFILTQKQTSPIILTIGQGNSFVPVILRKGVSLTTFFASLSSTVYYFLRREGPPDISTLDRLKKDIPDYRKRKLACMTDARKLHFN